MSARCWRARAWLRASLALWAGACLSVSGLAAPLYSESEVKAAFLHRFSAYVEWPAEVMAAPRFVIAVLGATSVADSLERALVRRELKGRPAEVRRVSDIRAARQAHIVYVGREHAADLDTLLPLVAARPLLIVTDARNGLESGGMLNFRLVERRVRFEVALDTAERAGLSISADLLSVALHVRRLDLRSEEICSASPYDARWLACPPSVLARRRRGWDVIGCLQRSTPRDAHWHLPRCAAPPAWTPWMQPG